jgi:hypothetical protein
MESINTKNKVCFECNGKLDDSGKPLYENVKTLNIKL